MPVACPFLRTQASVVIRKQSLQDRQLPAATQHNSLALSPPISLSWGWSSWTAVALPGPVLEKDKLQVRVSMETPDRTEGW